jgi:hypothetical protein
MTGFESKREAAADKLQEPVNLLEARKIAAKYGTPNSQVDDGNLYFALSKCLEHIDAQPAQRQWIWLSDADIAEVVDTTCQYSGGYEEFLIKKAERKIKELNT